MYYMIRNNAFLLRQTNDGFKKNYEKNRPILTVINVWRQCLQVNCIILPMFSIKKGAKRFDIFPFYLKAE